MKTTALLLAPLLISLAACNMDPVAASKKYVANAGRYRARGRFKEASILYRRALAKNLRSADAWYGLGLVNSKLGELPEARKDFSRAMELDPANRDAAVQLGDLDLAFYLLDPHSGRAYLADLKEITDRLLKKDSRSFDGLRFSGNIALASNDTGAAILKFQQANSVRPNQPDLTLTLVQTLFAAGRDEEAEKLAAGLLDRQKTFRPLYDALYVHYMRGNRPELAEQVLQRKVAANPKDPASLIQLAFHYFVLHRVADEQYAIGRLTSDPKTFPSGHLDAGDFYVRIRDYAAALLQYQQGERANPNRTRLYREKMAEVLATQGARDQAEKIVAGLLHDDSKDPEALALHATLMLAAGDLRQVKPAIAILEPLIAKMPRNAALHFNLGRAYMTAGDQRALEQFETTLRLDPHHTGAKLALAELALAQGQPAQAAQATTEILSEDPSNLTARLIRAKGLARMAETEKARQDLTVLLQKEPTSKDGIAELAELDFRERRYHQAEDGFRALVRVDDARGAAGLLKTEIAQGKIQSAVQFASDLVKRWPNRADTRQALAETLVAAGSYNAAAAQFQVLITLNPKSPVLYLQMGESKLRGDDISGALAAFQTARQLAPSDARAVLDLALLYDRTGRSEQARKDYETVIQLQPENATALNNLAYLEAEEGVDLDQALAHAERARQKMPGDLDVEDTLALVYIRKNLTSDSVRMLRDLVSRKPDSAPFHLHLALALYQKGDRPSAKRELQSALRYQPSAKDQLKIRELLAKVG